MRRCIDKAQQGKLKEVSKYKQWLWFIGLWCAGLFSVSLLGLVIKLMMLG